MFGLRQLALLALGLRSASAGVYNTFDGEGSPSCYNVTEVQNATSVDNIVELVKDAKEKGLQVRAGAQGHMWYDTQCSDDETMIIRTEHVNGISDFDLDEGVVTIESGVTFFQYVQTSID